MKDSRTERERLMVKMAILLEDAEKLGNEFRKWAYNPYNKDKTMTSADTTVVKNRLNKLPIDLWWALLEETPDLL